MIRLLSTVGRSIQNKKWLYKKLLLLCTSSCTLNLAFFVPQYFFWLVFLFLVPIFYLEFSNNSLSFKEGFFWGVSFNVPHYWPFIRIFWDNQFNFFSMLLILFVITYASLYAGLWFFISKKIISLFNKNIITMIIILSLSTYVYFLFMNYGVFFIFGQLMGDPFIIPIIPLAYSPKWLFLLSFLPKDIVVLIIILFSAFISIFLVDFIVRYAILSFIFFLPFLLGRTLIKGDQAAPAYINSIGYICPLDYKSCEHPIDLAQEICYKMIKLLKKNPDLKLIVTPESSYRFCLNGNMPMLDMWYINALDTTAFFVGSQRSKGAKVYNCVYLIKEGKIRSFYDKVKLMPFAEFIPKFWKNILFFRDIFLKENESFSSGDITKKNNFNMLDKTFEPYICYDFFFGHFSNSSNNPIILSVNDSYFQAAYMSNIMLLYAKFKSLELYRDILYVGCYNSTWINRSVETF